MGGWKTNKKTHTQALELQQVPAQNLQTAASESL